MKYFPNFTPKERELLRVEHQKGMIKNAVEWFSYQMKTEMEKHLDRPGWKRETITFLFNRLLDEVFELSAVLNSAEILKDQTVKECADVANFAMMIADLTSHHPGRLQQVNKEPK